MGRGDLFFCMSNSETSTKCREWHQTDQSNPLRSQSDEEFVDCGTILHSTAELANVGKIFS